ncbi:TniB family NTP-binding protein [Sulfitobacter pseudonitzschiae]|uniref:TniB family NTP-binding protein n=1 Tax=Pseudosulfitobacter pseudonitzschiae TaxID=1402135 RepID=A0A9Q2RUA3_9RHOB|nr:TniB family NTP-binding protein [Pseudosulfitobacter pseudonitzschiae]MBM2291772.1 TniB family NTP-binding protein [Pseudosulfitobacter pseudonitzschiae]MBM2296690.1 TniB family NTP-binding protein [Pseudosulfitobacter pseudonitzschiae]MBM2301603.1 TniB family NTP-binding protein [Pseudosulfitobacter pseudonitzschiae]MBM2311386.1 TniB family NTP-binding protein [Pseudosulfitobacter pseudonitzschiae]MBM2316300.1 TniB family NTP-binding protein [Pseudosulfitobacter pseudonitzschiae]
MAQADTAKSALERVRSLHIGSARDAEAAMHTTRLLATDEHGALTPVAKRFTRTGETRGVMLIGGPGSGKSHLLERTLSKLTVLQEGEYGRPRYLGCSVPSPATFKSMTLALLAESGYPDANPRKEAWSLWQDLRHRLQLLGISVLWIDEAQDLFCADRKLILRALKSLMQGDDAVIVVLSGTEDLAKVIRTDPQVQRRFTAMVLPDLAEQVDGDSFRDVITQYCERLGLGAPIEADLIGRIFHGARYRFGRALELLLQAMEIAIGRGDEDLDIGHFAAAYAMNEACTAAENVFYAEHYWLLKPDTVEEEEHPRRKKR